MVYGLMTVKIRGNFLTQYACQNLVQESPTMFFKVCNPDMMKQ